MKKTLIFPALVLALAFISCKKDVPLTNESENDISKPINTELTAKAAQIFSAGDPWRIAILDQNGTDRSAEYAGYVFTFSPDNIVTASDDRLPFDGSWWILHAGGGADNYFEIDLKLNDQTAHAAALEGLWVLTGMDSFKITLDSEDKSERLVFVRMM